MKVFARLVVGAASMVINSSAGAQKPMVATLLWATEARFTDIGSARLGGDGSVLVADAGSAEVHFITNQGRVVRKVGGVGSGPGEYRQPLYVFPHAGLTALIDPALRRLTYFGGDGTYARTTPLPSGTSGVAASPSADSMGNLWFRGMPSDPLTAKTVSLLHLTVGKETIDTVTAVSATSLAHIATPATDKAEARCKKARREAFIVVE